jgi:hypothetical protein
MKSEAVYRANAWMCVFAHKNPSALEQILWIGFRGILGRSRLYRTHRQRRRRDCESLRILGCVYKQRLAAEPVIRRRDTCFLATRQLAVLWEPPSLPYQRHGASHEKLLRRPAEKESPAVRRRCG